MFSKGIKDVLSDLGTSAFVCEGCFRVAVERHTEQRSVLRDEGM